MSYSKITFEKNSIIQGKIFSKQIPKNVENCISPLVKLFFP